MTNKNIVSSTLPMDMSRLKTVTDGKSSFQEELLEMFFFNTKECIAVMERSCYDGVSPKWLDASEELKTTADVLGAVELSKICEVSKGIYDANMLEKREMLEIIKSNVNKVMVFVRNTRY